MDPYQGQCAGGIYDHGPHRAYADPAAPYAAPMAPPAAGPVHCPPGGSPVSPAANYQPLAPPQQQPYYEGAYAGPPNGGGYPVQYSAAAAPQPPQAATAVHYHVCHDMHHGQRAEPPATQYSHRVSEAGAVPAPAYVAPPQQQPPPQYNPAYAPGPRARPPPPMVHSATAPVAGHYGAPAVHLVHSDPCLHAAPPAQPT
ncbi:hypothetical protein H4R21_006657, partial [Coemansia helicoidea]